MKLSKLIEILQEYQQDLDHDPTVVTYEPYSNMHERPVTFVSNEDGEILISCE